MRTAFGVSLFLLLSPLWTAGCSPPAEQASKERKPPLELFAKSTSGKDGGQAGGSGIPEVEIVDVKVGTGRTATEGETLHVHYTGWLADNEKMFDTTADRGPFTFRLGSGVAAIRGWHEGILGMKVGGKRLLRVPAALAYGAKGRDPEIPPNADLIFEIQLVKIE